MAALSGRRDKALFYNTTKEVWEISNYFQSEVSKCENVFIIAIIGCEGVGKSTTLNELITADPRAEEPFEVGDGRTTATLGCDFLGPIDWDELAVYDAKRRTAPKEGGKLFILDCEGFGSLEAKPKGFEEAILSLVALANVTLVQVQGSIKETQAGCVDNWLGAIIQSTEKVQLPGGWAHKTIVVERDAFTMKPKQAPHDQERVMHSWNDGEAKRLAQHLSCQGVQFFATPRSDGSSDLYRVYLGDLIDAMIGCAEGQKGPIPGKDWMMIVAATKALAAEVKRCAAETQTVPPAVKEVTRCDPVIPPVTPAVKGVGPWDDKREKRAVVVGAAVGAAVGAGVGALAGFVTGLPLGIATMAVGGAIIGVIACAAAALWRYFRR